MSYAIPEFTIMCKGLCKAFYFIYSSAPEIRFKLLKNM